MTDKDNAWVEHLDNEIRRLEREPSTWASPLRRARLEAIRRMRQGAERFRLQVGWSRLGTDGSHL
jgi:hypothetical protein